VGFGEGLRKIGLVTEDGPWQFSVDNIREGGYQKMFKTLRTYFDSLMKKTGQFLEILEQAQELIAKGDLQKSFNENRFGDFKRIFGLLFLAWNEITQVFYYSSIISLELWYLQNGYGSLINVG